MPEPKQQIEYIPQNLGDPCRINDYLSILIAANTTNIMALTESNMVELGTLAPYFKLTDVVTGESISTEDLRSDLGTVVMFWCNHCPYVIHVTDTVIEIAEKYMMKGFNFVAISSNDIEKYPQDSPEKMRDLAREKNYPFPYLFDSTQNVAKDFDAACTPDFYVFNQDSELVYRGQLDDSRPGNDKPLTGSDLIAALDALILNKPISENQSPSAGCNIKWK